MMGTGRIHIYYGDGKGKTTAAVGQEVIAARIRTSGALLPVPEGQFIE